MEGHAPSILRQLPHPDTLQVADRLAVELRRAFGEDEVHRELRRKGATLALLWEEYRAAHPDGLQYSWFRECYRAWVKGLDVVMRREHRGGEALDSPVLTMEQYAEVMKLDPEGVRTRIKRGICAVRPVGTPGRRGRYWHYASVAEALDKLRT